MRQETRRNLQKGEEGEGTFIFRQEEVKAAEGREKRVGGRAKDEGSSRETDLHFPCFKLLRGTSNDC